VPAASSQPAASEPTHAHTSSTTRSQPAFGANGTLGPGRGAPGTQ
jgi:hypothetical protein